MMIKFIIQFFEFYPDLLNKFFKLFEKLIIGMAIYKQENILFRKNTEDNYNLNSKNYNIF